MRISLVVLFCAVVFSASASWADDKPDVEKELNKFQGAC